MGGGFFWAQGKLPSLKESSKIKAIASFSILADLVTQVGGDRVEIITLVGPDQDVHVYEPTPENVKSLSKAQIVFLNGLNFESWMTRLISASGYKGPLIHTTDGIKLRFTSPCCQHHGEVDPHGWHNIQNVKVYVENIKKGLQKLDPEHSLYYEARAKEYTQKLEDLETWVLKRLKALQDHPHKIITTHAAFGYLEDAYGVSFWSPVGISTDAEPSTRDMIRLINYIKEHHIKMVFLENISNKKLMEQVQNETGAKIGGVLYSDGLSHKNGPAFDYISMMRHNISLISQIQS